MPAPQQDGSDLELSCFSLRSPTNDQGVLSVALPGDAACDENDLHLFWKDLKWTSIPSREL